jgi:ribosomal protein L24E
MTAFAALDDKPRYVAWRNEMRRAKATKVPYGRDGRHAKADDPATWVTRSEAEVIARRHRHPTRRRWRRSIPGRSRPR